MSATITPYLYYEDGRAAADWLCRVFGFEQRSAVEQDGRVTHAELVLDDDVVFLGEPGGEYRNPVHWARRRPACTCTSTTSTRTTRAGEGCRRRDQSWSRPTRPTATFATTRRPGAPGPSPTAAPGAARGVGRARPSDSAGRPRLRMKDADAVEIRVLGCLIEKQRTTPTLPALAELAAARLQPVHEPRPGRRLRRGDLREALHVSRRGWARLASGPGAAP